MGKLYVRYNGKMSREDGIYVRRNGNQDIAIKRKEGYQYTRSEVQREMRADFGERAKRAAAWRKANEHPPTAEYKCLLRRYNRLRKKDPKKYASFWNYLIANLAVRDETIND